MCYQVCIACPFSSRFSKTKQETSNTWRKPLRSVGVAPIKNDHQKKGPAPLWGICVVCGWFLIFQRNSFQHLLELLEVEAGVVFVDKNYATNKHHFCWKGFFLGENVTLAAGCTFLLSFFGEMIFQRRHLQGPGSPIAIVRPKG